MKRRLFAYSQKTLLLFLAVLTASINLSIYSANALTSADFSISQNGINFICNLEKFRSKCYVDNTQSSIGFGTKCTGSSQQPHAAGTHSITREAALAEMKSQVNSTYAPKVRKQTAGITMNQNQFDALVSLCYNTGGGTSIISKSPLVKYLRGELTESAARSQYSSYKIISAGKVEDGLINRRNAEANLFFKADDNNVNNSNFVYNIEGASAAPGGVAISGWCYDKRNTSQTLKVHVYFGGPAGSSGADANPFTDANKTRTDVDNVHHCGTNHGFDTRVYTSKRGSTPVYIYAVNPYNNESTLMHSFTANISNASDFHFSFDGYSAVSGGGVAIEGWVYDKNDTGSAIGVHTYIGGRPGTEGAYGHPHSVANKERTDVDNAYHCGKNHGFQNTIYSNKTGSQPVYVYAVSPTTGESVEMFSFTVNIPTPNNPEGVVDNISAEPGKIKVKGWTFDRDDFSSVLDVHVYIGGPAGSNAEIHGIKANTTRSDVDNIHHCGTNHGFDSYIGTSKTGIQDVYIYGINVRGGENVLLGSGQVAIPADTVPPVITETGIDHVTRDSYRVTCKVTDNSDIDRVEVWTWTRQQTDMIVYDAALGEDGEYFIIVNRSDHASTFNNLYHNHIFAYDVSGNSVKAVQDYDYQISSDLGKNVSEGEYRIISAADESKALDVYAASTENDANVHIYPNLSDPNQTFGLSYTGDGFYTIKSIHADKYFDVHGCSYQEGSNVAIWGANGDVNQQWMIKPAGGGYYNIIARNNGLALTVQSDDDVKVNTLTNSASQKWKLCKKLTSDLTVSYSDVITNSTGTVYPQFTVSYDGKTLANNTDYQYQILDTSSGGSISLSGINQYYGDVTKQYTKTITVYGDADTNNTVSIKDGTFIQKYLSKLRTFTSNQIELADANRDGKVDIRDVTAVQRHIAGIISLPSKYHFSNA